MKRISLSGANSLKVASLLVAGGMLLGRMSGLVREMAIAGGYGATRKADLAIFAMTLPDLLTSLLVGGAVASVLVPQYFALIESHGQATARALIGRSLGVISLVGVGVMLVLYLTASLWVPILGPGFTGQDYETALSVSRIALLAFPLGVISAVVTAALQVNNRLIAAVSGTLVLNATVITVLLCMHRFDGGVAVAAWAVVAGATARLAVGLYFAARDGGLEGCFRKPEVRLLDRTLLTRYFQALAAIGLVVCFPMIARAVATHTPGDSAAISYALKLMEVPVGLATAVIGFVYLPRLSQAIQRSASDEAARLLKGATIAVVAAMLCACIGFSLLASPVIHALFAMGQFSVQTADQVIVLARITIWAAPFAAITALFTAYCHAKQDTRTPLVLGMIGLGLLVAGCFAIYPHWGAEGIAASLLISHIVLAAMHVGLAVRGQVVSQRSPVPLLKFPTAEDSLGEASSGTVDPRRSLAS